MKIAGEIEKSCQNEDTNTEIDVIVERVMGNHAKRQRKPLNYYKKLANNGESSDADSEGIHDVLFSFRIIYL